MTQVEVERAVACESSLLAAPGGVRAAVGGGR
jgi:hypothetical protein